MVSAWEAGGVAGLLGHRAGKSTTIRMLTGQTYDARRGEVAGYDVANEREKIRPFINLVFEGSEPLSASGRLDNLRIFTGLYAEPKGRADSHEGSWPHGTAGRKSRPTQAGMKQPAHRPRANRRRLFLDGTDARLTSRHAGCGAYLDLSREARQSLLIHTMEEGWPGSRPGRVPEQSPRPPGLSSGVGQ